MGTKRNDFTDSVKIYYDELSKKKYTPLTKEEEYELITLAQAGDENAREKLVNANLRFAFNIAKRFTGNGVSIGDLIGEANIGLLKAIDKFDTSRGIRFVGYAIWWIKQTMFEAIEKQYKYNSNNSEIIASSSNEKNDDDNSCVTYIEVKSDDDELQHKKEDDTKLINKLLSGLTNKEREIIINYYGLENDDEKTLNEIGDEMNLTGERIRQLKTNAIRKLRVKSLYLEEAESYLC